MKRFLLLLAVFCLFFGISKAQDFSNKGKDFYLCYPQHVPNATGNVPSSKLSIWITSDKASSGTITMANGAFSSTFSIAANGLAEINVPFNLAHITNGESSNGTTIQILKKSIRVKVNPGQPAVVAYAQEYGAARSAASLLLPVNVLGKKYYAISFNQKGTTNTINGISYIGKSQFQIIATKDNTVVTITPRKNGVVGTPFTVTFPLAGDMIQYQSTDAAATTQDLTGTYIESVASGSGGCLPIAVFSGTSAVTFGNNLVPACTGSSYDPLFQQLYPISTWGKNFGFIPFANYPAGVPYRVMASENGTNVYFNGVLKATLNAGEIYPATYTAQPVTLTAATSITADKPICVAEYMQSSGCAGNTGSGANQGDPDMVILNPIEQNIKDITIFSTKQEVINTQWIDVVIPTAGITSFRIGKNGGALAAPTASWQTFTALPGYSYLKQQLDVPGAGSNPLSDSYRLVSDSGFNAIAYGLGDNESYAYSAGTNVKDLYQQISVSSQYGIETSPSVCTGSPFKFKISLPYKPIQLAWNLSSLTTAGLTPPTYTYVQNPDPTCTQYVLPNDQPSDNINYACPDSIRFVNGKAIYWFSIPTFYSIANIGTYPISIIAQTSGSDGCGNEQEINFDLEVSNPPVADFTFTTPGCVADTVRFSDNTSTVKPNYHWYWDFGDPGSGVLNYSSVANPVHLYTTAGPHTVRFSSITTPGCLSDTLEKIVNVPAMPSANISASTNVVCVNGTAPIITFTGSGGTTPYTFTYKLNSVVQPTITSTGSTATVTVPVTAAGTFLYELTNVQNTPGAFCTSPLTGLSVTVTVNPLPTATISGTAAVCQNGTAPTITFTGANGTAPYTFTYHIGSGPDLTVQTTVGNTKTITAPTGVTGSFVYTLTSVTDGSSTACTNAASGTATITVNPLPTATISGTTELCSGAAPPVITFTGAGGTAPYTFTYDINSGGSLTVISDATGVATLNPSTATAGTFIYHLLSVQESTVPTNCSQTQTGSATVIIDPLPTASFTSAAPYCESKAVTFTPTFSVASGTVTSWIWDYGDGTGSHVRPDGNPFTVTYTTTGIKTVTFQTASDKGCESPVFTANITINAKPEAGFISPEVCLLDPFAQFTDTSKVAAPGTISTWAWNFADPNATVANPNTSGNQNPTHIYTQVGTYNVQLIVTSNFGCKDTVNQNVIISAGNPVADFVVQNAANLCANDTVRIQNKSTIGSGQITKLEVYWDFLNTPAVFDADADPLFDKIYKHKYPTLTTDQNYSIKMRSYSGNLCFSEKTVVITVHGAPVVQLNNFPDVCLNNGTVQFTEGSETGGVAGPPGVYSGAGVSPTGLFNPITAGVGTHPITYTFTSNFGCTEYKTKDVKVLEAPVGIFTTVGPTCQNATITFSQNSTSAEGTITQWIYHWGDATPDQTFNNGGNQTHTYTAAGTVTATLTVVTGYGCKSLPKSLTFNVNPQPLPDFTFTPVACLPQARIDFTNNTPNIANWVYSWDFDNPGGATSSAVNPSYTYTVLGPHSVNLVATSPTTGCTNSKIKIVNSIHPAPFASFDFNKASICAEQNVGVIDHSTFADGTAAGWVWNYGDLTGNATGQLQPAHTYTVAGTYNVKLTITNNFGCVDDTTREFIVYPYPVVSAGPDLFVLEGGNTVLLGTASGNDLTYLWTPSTRLSSTTVPQPVSNPAADITYTLTVTARGGCAKSDNVFVKVLKFPEIPNTFTPNNDGVHDKWDIKYLYTYPDNKVQIFTRTGQLVFESKGYRTPWDGTLNGKSLPFDTYYYIIEPGNGRTPITGYVTIIK